MKINSRAAAERFIICICKKSKRARRRLERNLGTLPRRGGRHKLRVGV